MNIELITNLRSSWLLNKFSFLALWEMCRKQYGEYAYWYKGVKEYCQKVVSLLPFHWFLFFSWRSWKAQWCLFWQSCNQRSDWVQHTFLLVVACRIIEERMMKLDLWFRMFLYTAIVPWCINHNSYFKTATFFIISRLVLSLTGVTKEKFLLAASIYFPGKRW